MGQDERSEVSSGSPRDPRALLDAAHELRALAKHLRLKAEVALTLALDSKAADQERNDAAKAFLAAQKHRLSLKAHIDALRLEQLELRKEEALQQKWFRAQLLELIEQGWTRQELADLGFDAALLAELSLLDHPSLT